jgi:uncharacterized membrane protein YhaH (DUF805 family)
MTQQSQPAAPPPPAARGPVPLSAPYYGAPFGEAFRRFWVKYADFTGRASRAEYWWWVLVVVVLSAAWQIIGTSTGNMGTASAMTGAGFLPYGIIAGIWWLATIVPTLSLLARRLHDVNLSGWFMLLGLIPLVGELILLVFTLLPPNPRGVRFDRPNSVV